VRTLADWRVTELLIGQGTSVLTRGVVVGPLKPVRNGGADEMVREPLFLAERVVVRPLVLMKGLRKPPRRQGHVLGLIGPGK
jgi:hypothetical protein